MINHQSTDRPFVTVLLPCYNAQRFLGPTLESLSGQTYAHFEILAIDDGSTDGTAQMLTAYAERDSRMRLEPNEKNRGLIYTLNKGVALAKGSLIARMDADDVALPQRLLEQVRYFSMHPDTDVLSSDVSYIGTQDQLLFNPTPFRFSDRVLRFLMFFVNPLCHPTVMGRREIFATHRYSEHARHSEDFELWHRMVAHGVVMRKLPQRLLQFRANAGSVSNRNEQELVAMFLRTSADAILNYFGVQLEPDVHRILTNRMVHGSVRGVDLKAALEAFHEMKREYVRRERLDHADQALVEDFSDRHLLNIFLHSYRRSSREDSARGIAAREAVKRTLRHPVPACVLAVERTRERISR